MGASVAAAESSRRSRQQRRQRAITDAVITEGSIRIEELAERFDISVMTVHRDLDELESRGLLRKDRGVATAASTALVESSAVYRAGRQRAEKEAIARAAMDYVDNGQAVILDDSTTTLCVVPHLATKTPLTVITNTLSIMMQLKDINGISLLALGGQFRDWCSAFMGRMTLDAIKTLRTDICIMSTSAITDGFAFHQSLETVDVKRAMFECASKRVLLADHTKFEQRALHMMLPLADFDVVIVDRATDEEHVERLRDAGTNVVIAD